VLSGCGLTSASSGYTLRESYSGLDFFSKFKFWTATDPSQGTVAYVGAEEAQRLGLIQATLQEAIIRPDSTSVLVPGQGRKSVRIQSRNAYNAGLFVAKINHMPTGCGVWPAFWMYGEDAEHVWPAWGEYDILEGVHEQAHVRTTLHTGATCSQQSLVPGQDFLGMWEAGESKPSADMCNVDAPQQFYNQGCSQRGPPGSFGMGFNRNGGGTYAAEWDPVEGHIRTWFWPAGQEPFELQSQGVGGLSTDLWGKPFSFFRLRPADCPAQHFLNMRIVFNINFCGDLGESLWQDGCPALAEQMSCQEYVDRHPEKFANAYWSIGRVDVYQQSGPFPANLGERIMFNFEGSEPAQSVGGLRVNGLAVFGIVATVVGAIGTLLVLSVEYKKQRRQVGGGAGDLVMFGAEADAALEAISDQFSSCASSIRSMMGQQPPPPQPWQQVRTPSQENPYMGVQGLTSPHVSMSSMGSSMESSATSSWWGHDAEREVRVPPRGPLSSWARLPPPGPERVPVPPMRSGMLLPGGLPAHQGRSSSEPNRSSETGCMLM